MLRDRNLVPLSHQHQHVLALCVRLDRALQANDVDMEAWQAEISTIFEQEVGIHFAAEEKTVFPVANRFPDLSGIVEELLAEHVMLRGFFRRAAERALDRTEMPTFVEKLATHIRKEERTLFEGMQKVMSSEELSTIGAALDAELKNSSKSCLMPNEATRLRPKK